MIKTDTKTLIYKLSSLSTVSDCLLKAQNTHYIPCVVRVLTRLIAST